MIPGNVVKLLHITSRNHFASWITKATNAHSEYVILLLHGNNGYTKASRCYSIRTFSVFFYFYFFEQVAVAVRRDSYSRTVQFEPRAGHWQSLFEFFPLH